MRPRTPILALITVLLLGLVSPGPAAAVWTSVDGLYYLQVNRVCRDGLVADIGASTAPGDYPVYVADGSASSTFQQAFYTKAFPLPLASTGAVPEMKWPFEHVQSLGRRYRATWTPARTPGSTVKVTVGRSQIFTQAVVEDCAVGTPVDPFGVGYVWADDPARASYRPSAYWSYNSRLLDNTVTRTAAGTYFVDFPGLAGTGGNAHVTAFGTAAATCKIGGTRWYPYGTAMRLAVRCFAANGTPADARFTASYAAGGGSANTYAFAWADQPATKGPYVARAAYQYNNSGGAVTVTRLDVGRYRVTVPNLYGPAAAGSVKVTAVGDTPVSCQVESWGPSATAEEVGVRCSTTTGQAADQQFTIAYMDGMNHLGDNLMADGYVWANEPQSAGYTPWPTYQRSTTITQSGTVTITRSGVGVYDVFLPYQRTGYTRGSGSSWDGGNVHVSAYGTTAARCQTGFWRNSAGQEPDGRYVRVYCFTAAGAPADRTFTMQYTAQLQ